MLLSEQSTVRNMARAALLSLFVLCAYLNLCMTSLNAYKCEEGHFPCENGQCIYLDAWCDSEIDCNDGSDEKYCKLKKFYTSDNKCNETLYFKCKNGKCIPKIGFCDGFDSCGDESDEIIGPNCTKGPVHVASTPPPRNVTFHSNSTDYRLPKIHDMRNRASEWLREERQNYGWGDNTHRAVIAWYLSKNKTNNEEDILMAKQLEIQLAVELARNNSKPMSITDLSLYVNALLATFKDPRNFYGFDLVQVLRDRTDAVHRSKLAHPVSPLVTLTLCITNSTTIDDVRKLLDIVTTRNVLFDKLDIYSLALMTIHCMKNVMGASNLLHEVNHVYALLRTKLNQKILNNGFPGNIYEAALLYQALNGFPEEKHLKLKAMDFILRNQKENGSFGDILATYYVLPILSNQSLFSLRQKCPTSNQERTPVEVLQNKRTRTHMITFSLEYAEDFTLVLHLKVVEGTNLLDVMRLAQKKSSNYRFKLDNSRKSPVVYSIGGIPNDAEKGMYWCLHFRRANDTSSLIAPYLNSMNHFIPSAKDVITFRYTHV